ncbi:hypothetical protein BQ9231_00073 [Cedratvirus lausannensis]|uniref:Uncharacterized protein n=1 Tax=Cedratvirus lausannensis TaxID=2023205 RepID=A0A285PXS4_9VIRU|nr:hypothetical protein BQ9231_00073 [Cedratvirus lausannensis]
MGNYLTNTASPGLTLEGQPILVRCKCSNQATYRFAIKVPLEASQKNFVKTYFALKKFSSGVYENREIFLGCERCVSEGEKQYFTYHPEGWTVGVCPATEFEDLCSESKNSPREHENALTEREGLSESVAREHENALIELTHDQVSGKEPESAP